MGKTLKNPRKKWKDQANPEKGGGLASPRSANTDQSLKRAYEFCYCDNVDLKAKRKDWYDLKPYWIRKSCDPLY